MTLRLALVLLVCFAASVVESVVPLLAGLRDARPDLLLCVVLYVALHDEWVPGAALALCTGYLSDLSSATPTGLYGFLAVLTFVVVRTTASAFKAERGFPVAVLAFAASLVHSLFAAVLFRFVMRGVSGSFLLHTSGVLWSAAATGVGAIPVFAVLSRIDKGFLQGEAAPRAARKGF